MTYSANLGFPRIGSNRELKKALEKYWRGEISQNQLEQIGQEIRKINWNIQKENKIDFIPSNDFSYYDHILDTICLIGAIPERYNNKEELIGLDTYFAMARGKQNKDIDLPAMEMTKWYDTNYHYIVPEYIKEQQFSIKSTKIFDQYKEAKALGINTRPVLIGPITMLDIGKEKSNDFSRFSLIDNLTNTYLDIIKKLSEIGVTDLQIDEPAIITDLDPKISQLYKIAYDKISAKAHELKIKIHLASYFAKLGDNKNMYFSIDAQSYHVDLVRAPEQLEEVINLVPEGKKLSLGIIDGRNVWINNIEKSYNIIKSAIDKLGSDRIIISPSCSLIHSPIDLDGEEKLDLEIKSWMAYAKQKLVEINNLTKLANKEIDLNDNYVKANINAIASRASSTKVNNKNVQERVKNLKEKDFQRNSDFKNRSKIQKNILNLPLFPTTTIGSFPQTNEVRKKRSEFKKGIINREEYINFLEQETIECIKKQEEIGLDVLVHGEFERNDMVEYFGEQLSGFTFSKNGWVQSYGSRCVKPPVIYGDVSREHDMTVQWTKFANENSNKPVKGMLTGPVTILQWSFVRDDQPRELTCKQIALAIRDEVEALEKSGVKIIQIDEAAIREGLPIHRDQWNAYLKWAVDSFKLSASVAEDKTQIHTHMCYSEFNDIIAAIADMDADVISIETSRSQMELLDAFVKFNYPNEIGPGVYDIHSPRVPTKEEMKELLDKAISLIPKENIWSNPDCGLKTRGWLEVQEALKLMVDATNELRSKYSA